MAIEWSWWILLSMVILIVGIAALTLLLAYFKNKLLANFSQKIWMTFSLGLAFALMFILGNGFLALWFRSHFVVQDFLIHASEIPFFFRIGLTCFIMNAFLILAFRSLFKILYRLKS